jgi:hypothetical protein
MQRVTTWVMIGAAFACAANTLGFAANPDVTPIREADDLKCEPATLRRGDTLRVVLPFPHGPIFAIYPPSGDTFYIAEPGLAPPNTLFTEKAFMKLKTVHLNVSNLKLLKPVGNTTKPEQVFAASGRYWLEVGYLFELDALAVEGSCEVEYISAVK